jgi:hypothetical protein
MSSANRRSPGGRHATDVADVADLPAESGVGAASHKLATPLGWV